MKTYCQDRSNGKSIDPLKHIVKVTVDGIVKAPQIIITKGITTESAASFLKNPDRLISDSISASLLNSRMKTKIHNILHENSIFHVSEIPQFKEELLKIDGIGDKMADHILKLR